MKKIDWSLFFFGILIGGVLTLLVVLYLNILPFSGEQKEVSVFSDSLEIDQSEKAVKVVEDSLPKNLAQSLMVQEINGKNLNILPLTDQENGRFIYRSGKKKDVIKYYSWSWTSKNSELKQFILNSGPEEYRKDNINNYKLVIQLQYFPGSNRYVTSFVLWYRDKIDIAFSDNALSDFYLLSPSGFKTFQKEKIVLWGN